MTVTLRAHLGRDNCLRSYTPDRVLAGITSAAVFQEGWSGELHHAVLADLPNSGTAEYHVLNPVTHGKIEKQQVWRDISVRWIAEGGGSNHAWRIRDLANSELDSLYGGKTGAFAGLSGRFVGRDSTWQGYIGYREVDPFSGVLVHKASDMTFPKRRHQAYSLWWDRTRQ